MYYHQYHYTLANAGHGSAAVVVLFDRFGGEVICVANTVALTGTIGGV